MRCLTANKTTITIQTDRRESPRFHSHSARHSSSLKKLISGFDQSFHISISLFSYSHFWYNFRVLNYQDFSSNIIYLHNNIPITITTEFWQFFLTNIIYTENEDSCFHVIYEWRLRFSNLIFTVHEPCFYCPTI